MIKQNEFRRKKPIKKKIGKAKKLAFPIFFSIFF